MRSSDLPDRHVRIDDEEVSLEAVIISSYRLLPGLFIFILARALKGTSWPAGTQFFHHPNYRPARKKKEWSSAESRSRDLGSGVSRWKRFLLPWNPSSVCGSCTDGFP